MTTVTTMASPARLPFASLGGARLRNMTNVKNKQNALASTAPSALKRRAPAEFDDVDSENIDPLMILSTSKKGRGFDFDLTKSDEVPLFAVPPTKPARYIECAQAAGQKRKAEDPVTPSEIKRRFEPPSASAPAGRSSKHKRIGLLSRRCMTTSTFTRVNPPSFSAAELSNDLPFSIAAALAGTVPKCESKPTHEKGWDFDIYEDTKDDQLTNLMEHRACTLQISDKDSSLSKDGEDNKENVPPIDGPAAMVAATPITTARRDRMSDESRNPLGDVLLGEVSLPSA